MTRFEIDPDITRAETLHKDFYLHQAAWERTQMEDEAVVLPVQQGIRSRVYSRGRYSPQHERGVHHFHRLLAEFLAS